MKKIIKMIAVIVALLVLSSCSQEPKQVHYGSDECAHCKMQISDERFAAQLITPKGKAYKFDAIECMADYVLENEIPTEETKFWASDFQDPGNWLDVKQIPIIKSEEIKSPMGESLLAVESQSDAENHIKDYPGSIITWQELLDSKGQNN